ncbi:DUF1273 domain-containing protein [Liquorilactobacillus satsumensis]|uniref:DUF1273 domain-containing protein n=1 Tax=Liquorilactobacillus satsumensis TaxID=259059 RepID=UPI0021C3FB7D|nr:DUF1273 domain-containing protein [Liquorilactobacillus satsumensis]MCP9311746.1 DUF1273 domain-containing protein [Liquorilactobacillus satsumensis]MCP9358879.1 DUF1273 domain-containing protein [Liquorilactobacillus satsumensis]
MRIWLTGYRSYELNIFKDSDPKVEVIKNTLKECLIQQMADGLDWVLAGGQLGIEQWGLEAVTELKNDYPELKSALMQPYQEFEKNWRADKQSKFQALKAAVSFSACVSQTPYNNPQQLRNWQNFMLTHTEGALLVYDPEYEGKAKYAYSAIKKFQETHDYTLTLVDMDWLETSARDFFERKNENDLQ